MENTKPASTKIDSGRNKMKKEENIEETNGRPVCEKCGNVMLSEEGEWVCPHCQGEIDFLGEEDDES